MQEPGKFDERADRTVATIRPIIDSSGNKATMPLFKRAAMVGSFGKELQ